MLDGVELRPYDEPADDDERPDNVGLYSGNSRLRQRSSSRVTSLTTPQLRQLLRQRGVEEVRSQSSRSFRNVASPGGVRLF